MLVFGLPPAARVEGATCRWASGKLGSFYIQDPAGTPPAPHSGIEVYVAKTITTAPPAVGDLVEVTGMGGPHAAGRVTSCRAGGAGGSTSCGPT